PWSELAFPTIGRTLECYFSDSREGCFPMRNEAIAPMLASYKKD
ncbi:NUDIX hydrolase, partial [Pseudomonas aeruginosa]